MITRIPYDRDDLKIGKKDKVLEVGPGHNPTFRANVIVEQYLDSNFHRCGNVKHKSSEVTSAHSVSPIREPTGGEDRFSKQALLPIYESRIHVSGSEHSALPH